MEAFSKLGIDFVSIGLYLLNTGVLIAVIAYFLVNPLMSFLDKRKAHIEGNINEADLLKSEFQKKLDEMKKEKEQASLEIRAQMEKMQETFTTKQSALIAEMEAERVKILDEARAQMEEEKKHILKSAEEETIKTMQKVVFFVLQNKVPSDVIESSVKEAWQEYTTLK